MASIEINDLIKDFHDRSGHRTRVLDGIDLTSQDVAIEIQRGLDKDRWFLVSHIAA